MKRRLLQLAALKELYRLRWLGDEYVVPAVAPHEAMELPQDRAQLLNSVESCHLCELSKRRKYPARPLGAHGGLMIVMDAPGAAQNDQGTPFAGPSGALLERMITGGMGLRTDEVYVTTLIKCHPFGQATKESIAACAPYLAVELELVRPKAVLALGALSFQSLSGHQGTLEAARGRSWPILLSSGIQAPLFVSHSLGYLSLNPSAKKEAMADLRLAIGHLKSC